MSYSAAAIPQHHVPWTHISRYGYPDTAPPASIVPSYTINLSSKVAEDLRAEETYLENRRKLQEDLRKAETNEAAAVEKRVSDEQAFEKSIVEALETARLATIAQAIAARATEELRFLEAEAKAANAAAAETKALQDRAAETDSMATEVRSNEIEAAKEKSKLAREAEAILTKSVAEHEAAANILSNCQQVVCDTPLPGAYSSGPYERHYGYGYGNFGYGYGSGYMY